MKSTNIVGSVLQISAGILFASTFFVEDNAKAVKRRWVSLGILGVGLGIQIAGKLSDKKII